jgi:hypothetical protein
MTSERSVKMPFRAPKFDREWRMTFILAGIALLLSAMVVVETVARHF